MIRGLFIVALVLFGYILMLYLSENPAKDKDYFDPSISLPLIKEEQDELIIPLNYRIIKRTVAQNKSDSGVRFYFRKRFFRKDPRLQRAFQLRMLPRSKVW